MPNIRPEKGIIEDHLRHLFEWTSPDHRFELRCIHPTSKKVISEVFGCRDYPSAAAFANEVNQAGSNVYVTVNPLRPDIATTAKDIDVCAARWQFIDIDGTNDPYQAIANYSGEFVPSILVMTGTEPTTRLHAYWLMSDPVDLTAWSQTQKGLAATFGSDPTVTNPSRIMRVAGTVSYPDAKKANRGYIPELVSLSANDPTPVDAAGFAAAYRPPPKPASEPVQTTLPVTSEHHTDGSVPLAVVAQALDAISPIIGQGRRQEWLALAMATKAANPGARNLFDQWQRQSPQYERSDSNIWDTIHPQAGSYPKLFAQATAHDPDWWRAGDLKVEVWWRDHIAETFGDRDQTVSDKTAGTLAKNSAVRFRRHKMSDLKNRPTPKWLIRDLIFEQQLGVVYAPPGSFKSFVALDLCSRLAHGMAWNGKRLKPRRVLYVAGEGFPMLYNRRLAWFKHHSIPVADDGLEVVGSAVDLTSRESVAAFIVEMQQDCDELGLIVFDTLSTCTAGQNESDSAVMTSAIENAKLVGSVLGAAVLLIHHPGKDIGRGARGHSSLKGNVDTEWMITRSEKDMRCTLKVTKQKDAEDGQLFHFTAHRVPLGLLDDDGEEMFSLALTPCEGPETSTTSLAGEQISREEADRITIATMMKTGEILSVNAAAKLICKSLGCKVRAASDRVQAAVPTEWTSVRTNTGVAELRRVIVNEKSQQVEMRGRENE
jgi:hypothetical protein